MSAPDTPPGIPEIPDTNESTEPYLSISKLRKDETNFSLWEHALEDYAIVNSSSHLLLEIYIPPPPASPDYSDYIKKRAELRIQLLRTIPEGLEVKLEITKNSTLHQLVSAIEHLFQAPSSLNHLVLRRETESTFFTRDLTLEEFLEKHYIIRSRQKLANYPNINDESVTIDFIMNGLRGHYRFKNLPFEWIRDATIPTSLTNLEMRLKSIQAHYKTIGVKPTTPPAQGLTGTQTRQNPTHFSERGGGRSRSRRENRDEKTHDDKPHYKAPAQPSHIPHYPLSARDPVPISYGTVPIQSVSAFPMLPSYHAPTIYQAPSGTPQYEPIPPSNRKSPRRATNHAKQALSTPQIAFKHQPVEPTDSTEEDGTSYTLDSGSHPTHVQQPTSLVTPLYTPHITDTATDSSSSATHAGTIQIQTNTGSNISLPAIANPQMRANLLFVHDLASACGQVTFLPNHAFIINTEIPKNPSIVGTATFRNGLYCLDTSPISSHTLSTRTIPQTLVFTSGNSPSHISPTKSRISSTTNRKPPRSIVPSFHGKPLVPIHSMHNPQPTALTSHPGLKTYHKYHLLFSHADPRKLQYMAKNSLFPLHLELVSCPPPLTCSACKHGKQKRRPHKRTSHSCVVAVTLSSDICGPISPPSRQGNRYVLTAIDTSS